MITNFELQICTIFSLKAILGLTLYPIKSREQTDNLVNLGQNCWDAAIVYHWNVIIVYQSRLGAVGFSTGESQEEGGHPFSVD